MMNLIRYEDPELSTWTPFNRLATLRDEMDRLFGLTAPRDPGLFNGWSPALDIYQDKDNVVVKVELPGMKKEEIKISMHEGMLTITGERKLEEERKEGETFRRERFYGKFHRTMALPTVVDAAKVTASYKDGILTVTLPKAEEAKPKEIKVNVS
jgi:HSP20 family protein